MKVNIAVWVILALTGIATASRQPAEAVTLVVESGADAGTGTLRDAIEQANGDPAIDSIRIDPNVNTIRLESSVAYTGTQFLSIRGNGVTIEPSDGMEGQFDLLISPGGADLSIRRLIIQNGADGLFIPVPANASGMIRIKLRQVSVRDNDEFGVHINDQLHDSDAGILMSVRHSRFTGNGTGVEDRDGVRVEEGGIGGIVVRLHDTPFG